MISVTMPPQEPSVPKSKDTTPRIKKIMYKITTNRVIRKELKNRKIDKLKRYNRVPVKFLWREGQQFTRLRKFKSATTSHLVWTNRKNLQLCNIQELPFIPITRNNKSSFFLPMISILSLKVIIRETST